ncbi:sensor histidine kinase [Streptomyces sp. NPDC059467]|uniref:sensor histidine kinase n=1 Tax=Streptomyces sp. NPDC059467 TaxID=3346844 RepID=UPI0036966CC9
MTRIRAADGPCTRSLRRTCVHGEAPVTRSPWHTPRPAALRRRPCAPDESAGGHSVEATGFPPEFPPRALDRFTRAEAGRTGEGSGLGLAFVQAVATAHGGTAHAENTGRGARVVLTLPC